MRAKLYILLLLCLSASLVQAQIMIGGSVYGGGNKGDLGGRTTVTILSGDLDKVYGGARQADIAGSSFVHIDGEHSSSYIIVNKVYGGNDVAGTIGKSKELPSELTGVEENKIDTTWNTFVRLSTKMNGDVPDENQKTYIGQLFAGGNGDYNYSEQKVNKKYDVTIDDVLIENILKPEVGKAYLEICGGSIVYAYGGGNNVTVKDTSIIFVDNPSKVVNSIIDTSNPKANTDPAKGAIGEVLTADRFRYEMGINTGFSKPSSDEFQIGRLFGGNNKADMAIRPVWNLKSGLVRNIYSGGNQGRMTSPVGILLEIRKDSKLVADNVYGGCRMADVRPLNSSGQDVASIDIQIHDVDEHGEKKYKFPAGLSARVLVRGGDINNVYGGNDITGRVYGGDAIGIYASIRGDVYGGGNGSYPYTDNPKMIGDDIYGDLYYSVPDGKTSAQALKDYRPNAEQVSLRLKGDDAEHMTYIGGSVYCGGNSATLKTVKQKPLVELKIGSYVVADNVFLGNNGENMVKYNEGVGGDEGVLRTLRRTDLTGDGTPYNSMDLTVASQFSSYMDGVALDLMPRIVFDSTFNGDPDDYDDYTSYFGSFFCGGNVGSVTSNGKISIAFENEAIIFDKVVGGCNNAFVDATAYNAEYKGGLIGDPDENGDKLELTFDGMKIQPKRWKDLNDKTKGLEWNTISAATGENVAPITSGATPESPVISDDDDIDRRLKGGNIYGGCYNSGTVNGNVIINVEKSINDLEGEFAMFDAVKEDTEGEAKLNDNDTYTITQRRSGVIRDEQGMDVLGAALNLFGGGYGERAEIWGSVTINVTKGYIFQIFGGGERGAIGKGEWNATTKKYDYPYNPIYSTTINMKGTVPGVHKGMTGDSPDMAESEFVYGGSFMGPIAGNTKINLGDCRVFDTFAGSCNADISGHTETYVGVDGGFPWVRDNVYGGNDLGGRILGGTEAEKEDKNFKSRVRNSDVLAKVYKYNESTNPNPAHLYADAYVEYIQGRVDTIFGGCYGYYDYTDPYFGEFTYSKGHAKAGQCKPGFTKPRMNHAFVNFRPTESNNQHNTTLKIHGAGQGFPLEMGQDSMQMSSYILVDVPESMTAFQNTDVFGAGAYGGVGMARDSIDAAADLDGVSAIVDLVRGQFRNVYGGSFNEGMVRRSVVNVPEGSTAKVGNLFGGGYGKDKNIPCDVYESHVNFDSEDATVAGNIYGGNNSADRTLYAQVNITKPVWQNKSTGYLASVYGAGYGEDTWAQYTEVNLLEGARVYEVYGGGKNGKVINKESLDKWAEAISDLDLSMHGYTECGLNNYLVRTAELGGKYNTNVRIHEGATVVNYAYGGGLGDSKIPGSGDVSGTTYIALLGGTVKKDLYAAGTTGSVYNALLIGDNVFKVPTGTGKGQFVASANAYIKGGTARNVYGGGWEGSVGYHVGGIDAATSDDIPGETHVIIGDPDGTSFINGIPAIERNAYGGGEGGAVFGTTNITLKKGFIGYRHFDSTEGMDEGLDYIQVGSDYYQEKLNDETWTGDGTNRLYDSGCVFGGGYIDNSSVDATNVKMYGGVVRNALFGGGEIAAVGRGVIHASGEDNSIRTLQGIYKAGKTTVELYEGQVHRNVFGGGRGYDNLGGNGRLYSDGYVFGKTEVHIFGGIVGTAKELALENGNVFGGGDIGFVYSAYEEDGKLYVGIKDGERYDNKYEGYYYAYDLEQGLTPANYKPYIPADFVYDEHDPKWVMDDDEFVLTEDCKVLVEPHCKATAAVTINGHNYAAGDYITTEDLNTMPNKNSDSRWESIDPTGIIIYNAVFAGGNTSSGSSAVYANSTTVFGNATASIHDVYHRDFITLGTGRTGGLYGDGNLTFVDGYRGLNITNYGTDYYTIDSEISYSQYETLPAREQAYYQVRYKCIKECVDKDGTSYYPEGPEHSKASTLTADEIYTQFKNTSTYTVPDNFYNSDGTINDDPENDAYWEQNGVCSIYAGRLMNTIQRADFCGVFGSRMVMQGAQDRVPEIVDHTNYTINRVREVSLNQMHSVIGDETTGDLKLKDGKTKADKFPEDQNPDDFADLDKAIHGNYFGIYNIVNYLGALTSDVHFMADKDIRRTDNSDESTYKCATQPYSNGGTPVAAEDYGTASYYDWKASYVSERKRNNGTSFNKVALASGVYLELTTEKSTGDGLYEKDWGYITGVIELDLINVQPGIGGGFVYAKNEHRVGTYDKQKHNTLTALNADAITRKDFKYDGALVEWETSGNFVHSTQIIIDDCYNISGKYSGVVEPGGAVPAHYWFIKGSVYVYDQYISAYTGAPNAYSESVDIPLTITAASHGTMKLLNVQPNKYAYYSSSGVKLEEGKKVIINEVEYYQNDPISYWDWYLLTPSEQNLFVDETYVTIANCTVGENDVPVSEGAVMLPGNSSTEGTYEYYKSLALEKVLEEGKPAVKYVHNTTTGQDVAFDFVFRQSNNLSHDTGYMLTYKVNNPEEWNTWYTQFESAAHAKNQTGGTGYNDGPTYYLTSGTGGVFGQLEYKVSNLISEEIYNTYENNVRSHIVNPDNQASFESAYLVTKEYASGTTLLHVGAAVSATQAASMEGYVAPAYICTSTIQLSKTEYIYAGNRMTEAEKTAYYNTYKDTNPALAEIIDEDIVPAYYCTADGLYGGDYYEKDKNYRGLAIWSSMSKTDREQFSFNYDALDLLIDKNYGGAQGQKYQYDSAAGTLAGAEANPAGYSLEKPVNYTATYNGESQDTPHNGITLTKNQEYSRTDYEKLPNEKRHYCAIDVKEAGNLYVVKAPFQVGSTPYAVGTIITESTYNSLGPSDQACVTTLNFADGDVDKTYYYCREGYTIGENTEGVAVTGVSDIGAEYSGSYAVGSNVPVGVVIAASNYNNLKNYQTNFTIHGIAPTETSTLYVSRESDIFNLSKEKIITVVYQYDYEESDVNGTHVTPVSERHVVNIHLQFKSGIPSVEDIKAPQIVLPGTYVGIREPHVTPGAYEVTGGGWKLFAKEGEAESHINGIEYSPNFDPLFWYQDGYYLAYYAKTYLGETYSNHVKVSVANYHDLKKVMEDKEHHYYVDNEHVKRDSKIYITDGTNGATQLKQLFDLSLLDESSDEVTDGVVTTGPLKDHHILNDYIKAGQNLEFIMRTNVSHDGTWTPIGDNTNCFAGRFHGDGYHIDGLDHSLFGTLCGSVYNLGVTGSFASAGVADTGTGYVENCWINTTAEEVDNVKAVFGNPTATSGYKVVNCYYPETKEYSTASSARGLAVPMPESAFYNGTVAYNLNGFYLYKRYNNTKTGSGGIDHTFYTIEDDGTLSAPTTKKYVENNATYCSSGIDGVYTLGGYVEDRYAYGDYRYSDGYIPEGDDERLYIDTDGKEHFYPIWPDDYIYFGQMLTYGWNDQRPHEEEPSRIVKANGRLSTSDESNRIYRAPAYYQSKVMDVAHFNPDANLVAYSKPKSSSDKDLHPAYPNMTAIDFAGHNDNTWNLGRNGQWFYQPLLDDSGLKSITNRDETANLLVYAPTNEANQKTYGVLNAYFVEPEYSTYYTDDEYRKVAVAPTWTIFGHLVQNDFTAESDQLLVDKQDFNCPLSYTFNEGKRMWYQRSPNHYVSLTNGWSTVSLPFTAELVSTQTKGEITHFYSGSQSVDANGTKIGHEYWLREYQGKMAESDDVFKAAFGYPTSAGADKTVGNTFLWDYYYSHNTQLDANTDTYQTYYQTARELANYSLLTKAQPYILGLPGEKYYEFDLSGDWKVENAYPTAPAKIDKQMISFVSNPGISIEVSDDEVITTSADGYDFVTNYMSKNIVGYLMNNDGNSFDKTPEGGAAATPFRPYFVKAVNNAKRHPARSIIFDSSDTTFAHDSYESEDPMEEEVGEGTLIFRAGRRNITVESTLRHAADVRIVSVGGLNVATFNIEPGAIVTTETGASGVYIVIADGGKYQKKLSVR